MSKIIIVEPNTNDKDKVRAYLVKGERGFSAYDIYIQNGGTLTEEEWLDTFLNADNYYNKTETDDLLGDKADASDVYTKTETDNLLDDKPNASDVYTKTETDDLLDNKINITDIEDSLTSTSTVKPLSANQGKELKDLVDDVYTKSESDSNYQPKVLSGTSDPSSSLGEDGDIYLQYSE